MPAYTTHDQKVVIIATSLANIPSVWPVPAPWYELPPDHSLTILRYDEPPNTCEPDLPAGAIIDPSAPCLTITAPVSAWADWAGHGLLTLAAPGEGWFTQP